MGHRRLGASGNVIIIVIGHMASIIWMRNALPYQTPKISHSVRNQYIGRKRLLQPRFFPFASAVALAQTNVQSIDQNTEYYGVCNKDFYAVDERPDRDKIIKVDLPSRQRGTRPCNSKTP
jgi:hypothetical protein